MKLVDINDAALTQEERELLALSVVDSDTRPTWGDKLVWVGHAGDIWRIGVTGPKIAVGASKLELVAAVGLVLYRVSDLGSLLEEHQLDTTDQDVLWAMVSEITGDDWVTTSEATQ